MQTTLLGLAIAFIVALTAALIGPYFIDWNQFRPQFEAEATQVVGAPVRVAGKLDARLLPTPSLRLRSITVGGANDLGKIRADKLDVEFSLSALMRGEWRATELTINGMALDLGLDPQGRIDWPVSSGKFNFGSLSIDRLNITGRIALHDASSRTTLELNDIAFSGDVRSLAASLRGDGNFMLEGTRYPFRVSSGQSTDGGGTRVHLNIDPGQRPLSADLEGVLSFEARAPRFEGAVTLAAPAVKERGGDTPHVPWRIAAKVKADPAGARLEQVEAGYGLDDVALKAAGAAEIRFGASPLLHATLSGRQLDVDRFAARDSKAAEPVALLPGLRDLLAAIPQLPLSAQIEFSSEQIMLGGRPLQNLAADLHTDVGSWRIDRLDVRAPGTTQIALTGATTQPGPSGRFAGTLAVDSSDPETLVTWLQGRSEVTYHNQRPLRLHGNVSVASDGIAVEGLKVESDSGAVEGRVAVSRRSAGEGSRLEADLKAEQLDLDSASALVRSLAGPQGEWPDEARLSLDISRATSGGQELRALAVKLGYDPKMILLDRLKVGQSDDVMIEGTGNFDRVNSTGRLAFSSTAASLDRLSGLAAQFAPSVASRLNVLGTGPGPVHAKLAIDVGGRKGQPADRATVQADLDFDAPQLSGRATISAVPPVAAIRGIDLEELGRSELNIETKLSSGQGRSLLALLGLDRAIAIGEGSGRFEGSVTGAWRAPLRLNARISGKGLDAEAQGTVEPWAQQPKASLNLKAGSVNFAPLLGLNASDTLAQNIKLAGRVSLDGDKLVFDDLDATGAGSRLRGVVAFTTNDDRKIEGEFGLDSLDLASAFALTIGAAGRDTAAPLGPGPLKGWRGLIGFQALHGTLPGGAELRPVSGTIKSDGQSLSFDNVKGGIGGGVATANINAAQGANGLALNARVQLSSVEGKALQFRGLMMPAGRASMQVTLASQGRSLSALTGSLSGSGTVSLESADIHGLNPRAFDAAIRASDNGQVADDDGLRRIVEPVLSAGALSTPSAEIPFNLRDGRLRVTAATLDADGVRAIISGGYDIPADQADIRASLASTKMGSTTNRPEIQLLWVGPPDALQRTVDVSPLSSWLAVRAIDRETRRLDSIELGEPFPASLPPSTIALPSPAAPSPPKAKAGAPRPPAAQPGTQPNPNPPVVSQQAAPLPPPIEVRPAPGAAKPKPRPPLVLTPPASTYPRPAF